MTTPAFDFCYLPTGSIADTVAMAQLGESLGFRTMWIPDQDFLADPFVLATAAAHATERMDIGIGITTPLARHSAHIARAAASVDEVSGQRLRLGMGAGNLAHVVRPMGLPADRPMPRVEQGLTQVMELLAGKSVRFAKDGPEVALDIPVARAIPQYVGTRGPKTLEMAGRMADGVLAESLFSGHGMDDTVDRVRRGRERSDRSGESVDIVAWQVTTVSDDLPAVFDAYRPWVARLIQAGPPEAMRRIGITDDVIAQVGACGSPDEAAAAVTDDAVRCLVLVGTPEELVRRITGIAERGATAVSLLSTASPEATATNLTRFAHEVMPAFPMGG